METIKAGVEKIDNKYFIDIKFADGSVRIPISDDRPNEVKKVFNALIKRLKNGVFQIELQDVGGDLFSQVAKEYIKQLNREVIEVHGEMKSKGLIASS